MEDERLLCLVGILLVLFYLPAFFLLFPAFQGEEARKKEGNRVQIEPFGPWSVVCGLYFRRLSIVLLRLMLRQKSFFLKPDIN